jgi:dTDP-4-dehydrorhamnose reductase
MKVLITGSSGMLAKDIINSFAQTESTKIYGVDLIKSPSTYAIEQHVLDLTNLLDLEEMVRKIKPDLIIHTAAIVNLNTCEENYGLANKLHIDSSRVLASSKARIIYISTDSVFNGKKGNYTEESIPDPLNNYARSKYMGELAVQANNPNHLIIRTNIFGYNIPLKESLCEWAIKSFLRNEKISGFDDVIFNAIYTKQLAVLLLELSLAKITGIINIASNDFISKYDFIKYLASKFDIHQSFIKKTSVSCVNFRIDRPYNTTLNIDKAQQILKTPSIYESIDQLYLDYIKELKNEKN